MKISLEDVRFEQHTSIITPENEPRFRARKLAAGWTLQHRATRPDGKLELTFVRRKVGRVEVTP